jgi:uncharacterized protein (DUF1800 family)
MSKVLAAILTAVLAAAVPSDADRIVHVLNRIGYGPAPGDVERVRAIGIEKFIDQQLHPERLDDGAVAAKLAGFETLAMSSREIAQAFEQPVLEARRERKAGDGEPTADQRMAQQRSNRVLVELAGQKIVRAVYSERQLQEVLTDFWFNHFNVDARKGPSRFMLTEYERDVIRPHVLGSFRDLLGATAKSPAMLFYLDNWMSADPDGPHIPARRAAFRVPPERAQAAPAQDQKRGLNENYARELMELHTLGVDGGYTQKDVTEVARAFTGWTIERPRQGGGFMFQPRIHDPGPKVVLGQTIRAGGGESDGERVLDILAAHPSTARFIATKLARRFVSDTPPNALVDRAAKRFHDTHGDLREVTRTILLSPEFMAADAVNAKAKTPFEFVVSALRTTNGAVPDTPALVRAMQQLGMPLYQCQPPTGYKDTADAWINTGALVERMNFATRIAAGDRQLALKLGSPEFQRR